MAEKEQVRVDVDASSSAGWLIFFMVLIVITHGEPDLLDVLEEFCRRYMEQAR